LAVKKVKFQEDGGIMMELFSPIPKKNPSPSSMLPRAKPTEFTQDAENGIMMKESNGKDVVASRAGKVLAIPPETAAKIQTKGQKFATYTSDGGIMLQAAIRKRNVVKNKPKEPRDGGEKVLESSPTGAQSASGRGRILLPPSSQEKGTTMVWKQREIDFLPAGSG
jgi:hypothetical protein